MLTEAKARAAWSMVVDLRRVGLAVGWTLFAVSVGGLIALFAVAASHPEWHATNLLNLTTAVAVGLFVSSMLVLALTYAVKAVADSIDSYQAAVQDIVGQLSAALPKTAPHEPAEPQRERSLHVVK